MNLSYYQSYKMTISLMCICRSQSLHNVKNFASFIGRYRLQKLSKIKFHSKRDLSRLSNATFRDNVTNMIVKDIETIQGENVNRRKI